MSEQVRGVLILQLARECGQLSQGRLAVRAGGDMFGVGRVERIPSPQRVERQEVGMLVRFGHITRTAGGAAERFIVKLAKCEAEKILAGGGCAAGSRPAAHPGGDGSERGAVQRQAVCMLIHAPSSQRYVVPVRQMLEPLATVASPTTHERGALGGSRGASPATSG